MKGIVSHFVRVLVGAIVSCWGIQLVEALSPVFVDPGWYITKDNSDLHDQDNVHAHYHCMWILCFRCYGIPVGMHIHRFAHWWLHPSTAAAELLKSSIPALLLGILHWHWPVGCGTQTYWYNTVDSLKADTLKVDTSLSWTVNLVPAEFHLSLPNWTLSKAGTSLRQTMDTFSQFWFGKPFKTDTGWVYANL